MAKWKKVGTIGVDAGLCWVGDPCYIIHPHRGMPEEVGKDWGEFCSLLESNRDKSSDEDAIQFGDGLGVAVSTGYGDGEYNVYARKTSDDRVAELRVVFISKRDEEGDYYGGGYDGDDDYDDDDDDDDEN